MERCLRRFSIAGLVLIAGLLVIVPAVAHGPKKPPAPEAAAVEQEESIWGCPMCETVRESQPGHCPICRMDLVEMRRPTADETRAGEVLPATVVIAVADGDHDTHRGRGALMPGVPDSVFYGGAMSILLLSFVLFEVWGRRKSKAPRRGRRFDLLRSAWLRRLIRWRGFVPLLQLPVLAIFGVILFAGLFGNQDPARNIAPALTWTFWWTWLALVILCIGKAWCTVCPWMAVADWLSKIGRLWGRREPIGLERRWPKRLRNIWLATILFLLLTWLELGFGVTDKPWLTASLGLGMVGAALATVLIFERKALCRYACLVGRVSGLYSMFAATELRASDAGVCRSCDTKDCFHGNDRGDACPTHQFLGGMKENTYCTLCLECVKSCPEDNVSWNLRPLGADLVESSRVRVDEAYLSVILLSMSAFHGLTMTPAWDSIVTWICDVTGIGWLAAFTVGMIGVILLPLVVYAGVCTLMKWFARDRQNSVRFLFIRFSYSVLPIALFYHLAHNLQHIFFEGKKLMRVASDPFGWGWDLFGTAQMAVDALLPVDVGWLLQVSLIIVGHVFGIFIAHRAAFALYADPRRATLSQIPMLVAMLLFSFQSLWLIAQPMVMRTAM